MRGDTDCRQCIPTASFQSAPRIRMRGDSPTPPEATRCKLFQSAPRIRMRGDAGWLCVVISRRPFQSAPRIRMRGDAAIRWAVCRPTVSIRAPHSNAGRPVRSARESGTEEFQSAPRIRMRGDRMLLLCTALSPCFNPRPAFECGATQRAESARRIGGVSIRAPHSNAGRRWRDPARYPLRGVSIRAPHSNAGRRVNFLKSSVKRVVSIRAPHSNAGRLIRPDCLAA